MDVPFDSTRNSLPKKVPMACDACRRKKRRCDGQLPCFLCRSTDVLCTYDRNDRRQQQLKRNTLNESTAKRTWPRDSIENATKVMPKNSCDDYRQEDCAKVSDNGVQHEMIFERSDGVGLQANSVALDLQDSRALDSTLASEDKDLLACRYQTELVAILDEHGNGPSKVSRPKVSTMREMQGKFRMIPKAREHNSHACIRIACASGQKVLPKLAATPQTSSEPTSSGSKGDVLGIRRQARQFVWRLEHHGYPVPGYTRTFGNLPFSSSINANGYPVDVQARQALNFSSPPHLVFPLIDSDESPLGRAMTDFQCLGRRLIAEGNPPTHVADEGLIDVTLFFRDRLPEDPLNTSTWTAEMLRAFRGTFSDELLLACAVCVGGLMRWLLLPTSETYSKIPSMMRPTDLQRIQPHPPWVDLMMFPAFRNALVNNSRDWVEPCIKAKWELLWPLSLEKALNRSDSGQQVFLSPDFATFVDNPKNWIMQKSILETFPEIEASEINISKDL